MGLFRSDAGPFLLERRAARRWRATCAASLETLTGESFGQLWDLSETGARVMLDSAPPRGAAAMLKWEGHKVPCCVAWAADGMCGVAFKQPLDAGLVSATSRLIGDVERPIATVGNIRAGRKRSERKCDLGLLSDALEMGPSRLVIALQRRDELGGTAPRDALTAGEEMFFFGSPLAHVLAYEANLRASFLVSSASPDLLPGGRLPLSVD